MRKGSKHSKETIEKMREAQRGPKNHNWKGGNTTKHAGHLRAQRIFDVSKGKERHHIDGDPLNNEQDNVKFVTRREHMIDDGRLEALIARNKSGKYVFARGPDGRYVKKE